ncbi:MAG: RNA polymerase sigma factor [Nitrospirota bacterium]
MTRPAHTPLLTAIQTYYQELAAFVRRKVGCRALAEDILQEAYLRLAAANVSMSIDNPRAYLYRAVGNLATDRVRQDQARARYVTGEPLPEHVMDRRPDPERALDARQRLAMLTRAVEDLPPRCREVFVLRHFDELSQDEIAQRLGISVNMVQKHLRKGLEHCAACLKERA